MSLLNPLKVHFWMLCMRRSKWILKQRQYGSFDINGNFFFAELLDWPLRNFNHLSQGVVSIAHSTKARGNWSTLVNRRLRLNLHVLNSFANMEGVKIMPRSPFKDVASSAFKNSPMQTLCCFFAYNANLVVQHWTKVLHTRYKSFLLQRN